MIKHKGKKEKIIIMGGSGSGYGISCGGLIMIKHKGEKKWCFCCEKLAVKGQMIKGICELCGHKEDKPNPAPENKGGRSSQGTGTETGIGGTLKTGTGTGKGGTLGTEGTEGDKSFMESWEKDDIYLMIKDILEIEGWDKRAFPHFIKNLIKSALKKQREEIKKRVKKLYFDHPMFGKYNGAIDEVIKILDNLRV